MRLARRPAPIVVAAAAALFAVGAGATSPRTFVASYGNDGNPCSRVAPCRSFAPALAQTADRGEIVVLDSAGYGGVTIAQSVTVTAPAGVYAGSSTGVIIDATGIDVVLRGLVINGGGFSGIDFVRGATLLVERCEISGMKSLGLAAHSADAGAEVIVRDTTIEGNGEGMYANAGTTVVFSGVQVVRNAGYGLLFQGGPFYLRDTLVAENGGVGVSVEGFTTANVLSMTIDRSRIFANHSVGVAMRLSTSHSLSLVISDTDIARNNSTLVSPAGGVLIDSYPFPGNGGVVLTRTTIDGNGGFGVSADRDGYPSFAILDDCVVSGNQDTGMRTASGPTIYTRNNNIFHHNGGGDQSGNIVVLGAL